jgi:hypothetical protein
MTDQPPAQSEAQPLVPTSSQPEPAAARPGGSPSRGARWVNVALAIAVAIAIGGVGFAAGRLTSPASATGAANGGGRVFGNGNFPGGPFPSGIGGGNDGVGRAIFGTGGASIEGTVESISGNTLTLKLANGSTIQVSLSDATTYHAQAAASAADVKTGATVMVRIQLDRGSGATSPAASDVTIVP